jgi:hypothetical protein
MTGPVVLVTRDGQDRTVVEWFENEDGWHVGDPIAVVQFDAARGAWSARSGRHVRPETSLQVAATVWMLAQEPHTDVSGMATHTCSKPGAPLEPVPGRAA